MWLLIAAVVSLSGSVLVPPPLLFSTNETCRAAAEQLETDITTGLEDRGVVVLWKCVETDAEGEKV